MEVPSFILSTRNPGAVPARGASSLAARKYLGGDLRSGNGTVALNFTTYDAIAIRDRLSSSVPSEVAGKLAEKASASLSSEYRIALNLQAESTFDRCPSPS